MCSAYEVTLASALIQFILEARWLYIWPPGQILGRKMLPVSGTNVTATEPTQYLFGQMPMHVPMGDAIDRSYN